MLYLNTRGDSISFIAQTKPLRVPGSSPGTTTNGIERSEVMKIDMRGPGELRLIPESAEDRTFLHRLHGTRNAAAAIMSHREECGGDERFCLVLQPKSTSMERCVSQAKGLKEALERVCGRRGGRLL